MSAFQNEVPSRVASAEGRPSPAAQLPEGGPVPAPRSEPDAIRDGVSRRVRATKEGARTPGAAGTAQRSRRGLARSEREARDGGSDKGDGPLPPQPKGQVHFRCAQTFSGPRRSGPARPEGYFETRSVRPILCTAVISWSVVTLSQLAVSADFQDIPVTSQASKFISEHEARVRPLEKAVALAWWQANISGEEEDFKAKEEAQNRLDGMLSDPTRFSELKKIRDALSSSKKEDETLVREIEVLYLQYLEKQVDPELLRKMNEKANAVEKAFNNYRAKVEGKELTDSEVRKLLKESKDSKQRRMVWEASKAVGAVVQGELKDLVKLRNEAARKLGFKDYHVLQLYLNEQSQEKVLQLFDELYELTNKPFQAVKAEIDAKLAKDYAISAEDLRP